MCVHDSRTPGITLIQTIIHTPSLTNSQPVTYNSFEIPQLSDPKMQPYLRCSKSNALIKMTTGAYTLRDYFAHHCQQETHPAPCFPQWWHNAKTWSIKCPLQWLNHGIFVTEDCLCIGSDRIASWRINNVLGSVLSISSRPDVINPWVYVLNLQVGSKILNPPI